MDKEAQSLTDMISGKGKTMLVHDGHKFYQQYESKKTGMRTMRCSKNTCRAKLYVEADNRLASCGRFDHHFEHNHEPDPEPTLCRQMVSNAAKAAAVLAPTRPPSSIVREEMERIYKTAAGLMEPKDMRLIARCVHNALALRRDPSLRSPPQNRLDVHRAVELVAAGLTLVNDAARGVIVFGTAEDAARASRLHTLHVDGALEYCPQYFGKLCVVHTYENASYQPLMFCCLRDGSRSAFEDMLNALRDRVGVRPNKLAVDCDENAVAAAQSAYPAARVVVNGYAVLHAWCREARRLSLGSRLTADGGASADRRWMWQVLGLPFLNANAVELCFVNHCMAERPDDAPSERFTNYLTVTFVDRGSCEFPPRVWAFDGPPYAVARHAECAVASRQFRDDLHHATYHRVPHVYRMLDTIQELRRNAANKLSAPLDSSVVELRRRVTNAMAKHLRGEITEGQLAAILGEQCNPLIRRYPLSEQQI